MSLDSDAGTGRVAPFAEFIGLRKAKVGSEMWRETHRGRPIISAHYRNDTYGWAFVWPFSEEPKIGMAARYNGGYRPGIVWVNDFGTDYEGPIRRLNERLPEHDVVEIPLEIPVNTVFNLSSIKGRSFSVVKNLPGSLRRDITTFLKDAGGYPQEQPNSNTDYFFVEEEIGKVKLAQALQFNPIWVFVDAVTELM